MTGDFPELDGLARFNSFKTYLKPAVEMLNRVEPEKGQELSKVKQSLEETTLERDRLQAELDELTKRFNEVKQILGNENKRLERENERLRSEVEKAGAGTGRLNNQVKQTEADIPANVEGWTVGKSGPYYKLFKKIDGKVKGIHMGKAFDRERAVEKIRAKEAELGILEKQSGG